MAILSQSGASATSGMCSAERELYRRAVRLIAQRAAESSFTLDSIAAELKVSKPYLQRAFRHAGTTPLRILRERRTSIAKDLLEGRSVTSRVELDALAVRAGFSSARAMKEAFRKESL